MLASRLPMWRSKLIVIIVFLAFAALIGRAFWVQVANKEFYVGQGQKRYQRTIGRRDARAHRRPQRRDACRQPVDL